ncbi:hypothetical protein V9K67_25345 [Paraflavisolibacter sp. H34]|uniref:hypothetical protein n=1 Tax=Huijunlia imazamoxiresistens TaxID=3127457 RepID=UPI0030172F57
MSLGFTVSFEAVEVAWSDRFCAKNFLICSSFQRSGFMGGDQIEMGYRGQEVLLPELGVDADALNFPDGNFSFSPAYLKLVAVATEK